MSQRNIRASCGLDFPSVGDIAKCVKIAFDNRYEFICVPLVHPRLKNEFIDNNIIRDGPFTRPDVVFQSKEWKTLVVGTISKHINVDSSIATYRKQSEYHLQQELDFASHLDLPAVIITVRSLNCSNLARILYSRIIENAQCQAWIHIPIQNPNYDVKQWRSDLETETVSYESTWEWWNRFHSLCNFGKRIGVALELTKSLPANEELERWFAEPVKCILICTSLFSSNKNGYPVLPKAHQMFLQKMSRFGVQIVIKGNNHHMSLEFYQIYLNLLWQNYDYQPDSLTILAEGMEEKLQIPLQPVTDNLNIGLYQSLERDVVKYGEYEKAMVAALTDLISLEEKEDKIAKIMTLGANRGCLVNVALKAAEKADRKIKIYAVEKNPYARVTLTHLRDEHWGDSVEIICQDVREIKDMEKVDIIFSELLGSFGDNELAPEILDGAQKFLKDEGISIPEACTSYISPVQNSKLHNRVKTSNESNPLEKPYVVFQKHKYDIAPSQPLFTFNHPNRQEKIDNSRYKCLKFYVKTDCVLHGFSGCFDSTLYKNIELSIVPEHFSYGVISWFPMFFPLTKPVHLKAGDEIALHFWRKISRTHVWYEWTISKPISLPIHNSNGETYKMGLR